MPCETCNHTVQNIGAEGRRIFWCPRCGSLLTENGDHRETSMPMLVTRVRSTDGDPGCTRPKPYSRASVPGDTWLAIIEAAGLEV